MRLPLLISVPHAGRRIPPKVAPICCLTPEQILKDGDEGAGSVYAIENLVEAFVTTDIPRAIVDVNRAEDDRRADGVVKTRTIFSEPVYTQPPGEEVIESLLEHYYRPYHARLRTMATKVVLGLDCHTMVATAPTISADAGAVRPAICLSNADGTCPEAWFERLARELENAFEIAVSRNSPFKGGYIIRSHAVELPWMQLELSRAPFLPIEEKHRRLVAALTNWCAWHAEQ